VPDNSPGSPPAVRADAGSDTLTVLAVHGDRITRLRVVPSSGSFLVSVAADSTLTALGNSRPMPAPWTA
jgi:hypothetical protein